MKKDTVKMWSLRGLMCCTFFALGACISAGCSMLRSAEPIISHFCPACGAIIRGTTPTATTGTLVP